jgi:predicted nicotinamide N-methyase
VICSTEEIFKIYKKDYALIEPDLFCPEIITYNTFNITGLWDWMLQNCSKECDLPYWSVIWPGGRAMARFVIDSGLFKGKRVLDFASGSGIVSLALLYAGADAIANDTDKNAAFAASEMAKLNNTGYPYLTDNILESDQKLTDLIAGIDCILCSDVFYEKSFSENVIRAFSKVAIPVYFADPGRMHVPRERLEKVTEYRIPVYKEIESVPYRTGSIYKLKSASI